MVAAVFVNLRCWILLLRGAFAGGFAALSWSLWCISSLLNLCLNFGPVLFFIIRRIVLFTSILVMVFIIFIIVVTWGGRLAYECLFKRDLGQRLGLLHLHLLDHLARCINVVLILFHRFSDLFLIGKIAHMPAIFSQVWRLSGAGNSAATWANRRTIMIEVDCAYRCSCSLVSDRFLILHELFEVHLVGEATAWVVSVAVLHHATGLRRVDRCTAASNRLDHLAIKE